MRIRDLSALGPLLADPGRRKLLHSGSGDMPILRRACGAPLRGLLDTQIAAAFAGLGPSLSYAALVKLLLGVELAKHETRTDWTAAPAVAGSAALRRRGRRVPAGGGGRRSRSGCATLGRLEWALEDSAALAANDGDTPDPAGAWRRVKGLDRLNTTSRAVARALAAWREREAERADLARPFLLRDETLLALAKRDALAPADAKALPGYDPRRHAHLGAALGGGAAGGARRASRPAPRRPRIRGRRPTSAIARRRSACAIAALVTQKATELGLLGGAAAVAAPARARHRDVAAHRRIAGRGARRLPRRAASAPSSTPSRSTATRPPAAVPS